METAGLCRGLAAGIIPSGLNVITVRFQRDHMHPVTLRAKDLHLMQTQRMTCDRRRAIQQPTAPSKKLA